MEKILKYKSWFLAIGIIITFIFSQRFLNNPWAEYVGETLVTISLNMEFISDKMENGKIGIYNTIAAIFMTGLWLCLTYFIIKDHLL
ncbi:hypothetical protein [Segatella copri]|uniref:hypothetical protein n=1 Tax=Segatella copri TaxID=165179 RepID=UPI00193493A3|nr:hypothetical protein [Segatella copri]MBM0129613.1 hypothetical protein [Segatella copri]